MSILDPALVAAVPSATTSSDGETLALQRCLRDVVALSTLPAAWVHSTPSDILESLAEVMLRILKTDLVYVRVPKAGGYELLEAGRTRRDTALPSCGADLGRFLDAQIDFDGTISHAG